MNLATWGIVACLVGVLAIGGTMIGIRHHRSSRDADVVGEISRKAEEAREKRQDAEVLRKEAEVNRQGGDEKAAKVKEKKAADLVREADKLQFWALRIADKAWQTTKAWSKKGFEIGSRGFSDFVLENSLGGPPLTGQDWVNRRVHPFLEAHKSALPDGVVELLSSTTFLVVKDGVLAVHLDGSTSFIPDVADPGTSTAPSSAQTPKKGWNWPAIGAVGLGLGVVGFFVGKKFKWWS